MHIIDFRSEFFPAYGEVITFPKDTFFFRSYDTRYPVIGSHPSHFGDLKTAEAYIQENTELGVFKTSRTIKLLDLRYIQTLLHNLFKTRKENDDETVEIILACTLAYGLCSFKRQIDLLLMRYRDDPDRNHKLHIESMIDYYKQNLAKDFKSMPRMFGVAEAHGVRIAETTNDGFVLSFLAEVFKHENIDGFIAPAFFSPYHCEKPDYMTKPELVIFNPGKSGITLVTSVIDEVIDIDKRLLRIPILRDIQAFIPFMFKDKMKTRIKVHHHEGGSNEAVVSNFEHFFHSAHDNDKFRKQIEKARRVASSISRRVCFRSRRNPTCKISPFLK